MEGDDPGQVAVLLLHGLTGAPPEMRPVAKSLRRRGYRVEVPLLPGHGAGHRELIATTWEDWLAGARQALRDLQREHARVFVGGLSMSALLCVALAVERPAPAGIVCCSPTYGHLREGLDPLQFLLPLALRFPFLRRHLYWRERSPYGLRDERLRAAVDRAIARAKRGQTRDLGLFRTYLASIYEVNRLIAHTTRVVPQARCPVLLLHSLDDTVAPIANAFALYTGLGAADRRIRLLTGCDHVMTVDLRRHVVAAAFEEFIGRVCAPGTPAATHLNGADPDGTDPDGAGLDGAGLTVDVIPDGAAHLLAVRAGTREVLALRARLDPAPATSGRGAPWLIVVPADADAPPPAGDAEAVRARGAAWPLAARAVSALARSCGASRTAILGAGGDAPSDLPGYRRRPGPDGSPTLITAG
ncbi:hypothetical protein GCM10023322_65000 [Rugosimonospora acidiphila]|uniref:Serine aminopeptidase S33 domain-containing protein n=1 Tax=Rugosimonospora acidiphila TaxID=556531 RepID=A0ABP9SKJ4_9ACTN